VNVNTWDIRVLYLRICMFADLKSVLNVRRTAWSRAEGLGGQDPSTLPEV